MPTTKKPSLRTREIQTIKVLVRKLGIDDGAYRTILADLTGHTSLVTVHVTSGQRQRVIEHLRDLERRMGLADERTARSAATKARTRRGSEMGFREEDPPQLKKVRMMWLALAEAGEVEAPTEAALNAWAKRQRLGADHVNWLDGHGLSRAIEALKEWHRRVGIEI